MNILLITEYFPESKGKITGGVESRVFYLARELSIKNKVYVLTSLQPGLKRNGKIGKVQVKRLGPEYPYTQNRHLVKRLLFCISAGIEARRICKQKKIDIVEGSNFFTYFAALFSGTLCKAKTILTYHEVWVGNWVDNTGSLFGFAGELAERFILLLTRINQNPVIAVSGFTRNKLIKQGLSKSQIHVIPNGVDISKYQKIKVKKERQPTICYLGRLTKQKRVKDLLKAAVLIKKGIKNVQVKIIGTGPERENLEKFARELNLKNISFLGFVKEQKDVIKTLKSSHVFCSPSVVEGFGITLVEAMACEIPFVCSDIEPYREVSFDGKGGLLFKPRNAEDLASKLIKIFNDKKFYKNCIKEEKHIIKNYDWAKIAREVEEVYKK